MKKSEQKEPKLRQESLFPPSLFGIYLGVLLLMAGLDVTFDTKWREKNSRFFGGFSLCLHQFF